MLSKVGDDRSLRPRTDHLGRRVPQRHRPRHRRPVHLALPAHHPLPVLRSRGIGLTKQEQVPLINVQDVDVSQTLLQKRQRIGNVLVHIVRPGGQRETAVLDSILEPSQVRDLINHTVHQVRIAAHQRQIDEARDLGTHRYEHTGQIPQTPGGHPQLAATAGQLQPGPPAQQPNAVKTASDRRHRSGRRASVRVFPRARSLSM
ncbi:PH domain-containing protein [Actinomadura sp. 3N407]|uniref:PH domain-containing protein n=1 Tax=Actinomadura sp. 3N407 TaxID=3457423 RepID=UPI003FCD098C